jgi:transitional endoplasmic reticulum ATPase
VSVAKALAEVVVVPASPVQDEHWLAALRFVQGARRRARQDAKRLDELVLPGETRAALDLLASRLKNAREAEALGAKTPRGALFFGPPGTGKTVAAQALAAESDWAFIPLSGPELVSTEGRLQKALTEAADLRPAMLFIDEADDALRRREVNPRPDIVNRLLVLMDGAEGLPRDVLVVASTNHIEQVDEALLRAGRFTEKVRFNAPDVMGVRTAIDRWMEIRRVDLPLELACRLANTLGGKSVATIEGVLQYALDRAAMRAVEGGTQNVQFVQEDLLAALEVVAGVSALSLLDDSAPKAWQS